MDAAEQPPVKNRSRKSLTCLPCRKRKVKCDFGLPCGQCKLRGKSHLCEYGEHNRWGYSKPNVSVDQPPQSRPATLKIFKGSDNLPDSEERKALFDIYSEHCHPLIPIFDLEHMKGLCHTLDTRENPSAEDVMNLLILCLFAYRISMLQKLEVRASSEVLAVLEKSARDLTLQMNLLQVRSVSMFKCLLQYTCYLFWADTPYYDEVCPLIGLLQGSLRGNKPLQQDVESKELFGVLEGCVASYMGLPSAILSPSTVQRDDLFIKCRHMLMKLRERVFSLMSAKTRKDNLQSMIELEHEIHNAGATHCILVSAMAFQTPTSASQLYKVFVIESVCSHLGMLLYRPFFVTSEQETEPGVLRLKSQGMAISLIRTALKYHRNLNGQFMLFALNDMFMGAFQAAILLAYDHFNRQRLGCCTDIPEDYYKYGFHIPPAQTSLYQEVWGSKSTTWRCDLAQYIREMFASINSGATSRAGRAETILGAFLSNSKYVQVPEIFGPFTAVANGDTNGQNGMIPAQFDAAYFTQFIGIEGTSEFEQRCHDALNEKKMETNT